MRRWSAWLGMLAVVAVAAAGLWSAAAPRQAASGDDVQAVASTLRCPTCVAESVADSTAPLSAGMRSVIEEQLGQGRTPDEIRAWFVERYGEQVLLEPPRRGLGLALWLLPLVAAPTAAWAVVRGRGRRGSTAAWLAGGAAFVVVAGAIFVVEQGQEPAGADDTVAATAHPAQVLDHAVRQAPGDVQIRSALARALDQQGEPGQAAEHYIAATRLAPSDDQLLYRAAFALVRADRAGEAVPMLEHLLARSPEHPGGLLLLGTVRHHEGDPAARTLLRRFLEIAPDHPAAGEAEAMLDGGDRT